MGGATGGASSLPPLSRPLSPGPPLPAPLSAPPSLPSRGVPSFACESACGGGGEGKGECDGMSACDVAVLTCAPVLCLSMVSFYAMRAAGRAGAGSVGGYVVCLNCGAHGTRDGESDGCCWSHGCAADHGHAAAAGDDCLSLVCVVHAFMRAVRRLAWPHARKLPAGRAKCIATWGSSRATHATPIQHTRREGRRSRGCGGDSTGHRYSSMCVLEVILFSLVRCTRTLIGMS
jgi:hypothetical protein